MSYSHTFFRKPYGKICQNFELWLIIAEKMLARVAVVILQPVAMACTAR